MRPQKGGFTTIELLTVLAIIAILVGILIPAVSFVRNSANEAKQKVQFAAIGMALEAFKGDYGDYPPSNLSTAGDYCGAQELCEALIGYDLLGFHPNSAWQANGKDLSGNQVYSTTDANLAVRKGPYLELGTANAFKLLSQLFGTGTSTPLADRYVLCDSFGAKSVTVAGKPVKAGRPILYYKANINSRNFDPGNPIISSAADAANKIYNYADNIDLINLKMLSEGTSDPLGVKPWATGAPSPAGTYLYSRDYKLVDPKIIMTSWPCRPDSYILISAGADGLYGTSDDITNF